MIANSSLQILPVKVSTRDTLVDYAANPIFFSGDIAKALDHVATHHLRTSGVNVQAINMSFTDGLDAFSGTCQDVYNGWPNYLKNTLDIALVAAAGNNSGTEAEIDASNASGSYDRIARPACTPHVVSVGATTDETLYPTVYGTDQVAQKVKTNVPHPQGGNFYFATNSDPNLDLWAPGTDVSTLEVPSLPGTWVRHYGTSFSSPFVAGIFARMRKMCPPYLGYTVDDILNHIQASCPLRTDTRPNPAITKTRVCLPTSCPP